MAFEGRICFFVDALFNKSVVEICDRHHISTSVYHWSEGAVFSFDHKRRYSVFFSDFVVVGSECRSYMNDSGSIFCCYKITCQYPESAFPGIHPCLLYTSPSPRDGLLSRMPSSA